MDGGSEDRRGVGLREGRLERGWSVGASHWEGWRVPIQAREEVNVKVCKVRDRRLHEVGCKREHEGWCGMGEEREGRLGRTVGRMEAPSVFHRHS